SSPARCLERTAGAVRLWNMPWEGMPQMTTRKPPIVAGKRAVQDRIPGINRVTAKLSGGREAVYYYHRATGVKLPGAYGSKEFLDALAAARAGAPKRTDGT